LCSEINAIKQEKGNVDMSLVSTPTRGILLLKGLISAGPDFILAGSFFLVWLFPFHFGENSVKYFMVLMLLEFVVIHSTAFLTKISLAKTSLLKKLGSFFGMVLFYSLFAGGFSWWLGSVYPLISFWFLTVMKYPSLFFAKATEKVENAMINSWAVMTMAYLGGVFATLVLPIPRFGITNAVVKQLNLSGTGIWIEQPHRVIAFGLIYFAILGLYELRPYLKPLQEVKEVTSESDTIERPKT
jgi:hypothetical protein